MNKLCLSTILFIILYVPLQGQVPYNYNRKLDTIKLQVELTLNNDNVSMGDIIALSKRELARLDVPYRTINFAEYGRWTSFYPSLYISKHENASMLLVFPLHNNPLLLSTMLYLATIDAPIDILAISPQNSAEIQASQTLELLIHKNPVILWIDKNIQSSDLASHGGRNRLVPPLFLNKLLLEKIPNIPVTAITHILRRSSILNFALHDVPLEIFLDRKIPASYLKSSAGANIDEKEWLYALARGMHTIAEALLEEYPLQEYYNHWEENYLSWNFFGKTFFISERVLIIFFLLLLFSTLFYGIYFRSALTAYAIRIAKHWFIILCIIIIAIMINGASSLLIWFIVRVLGQDLLFERWAILLKLALTFVLFTTLYQQLSRTPAFWARNRYLSATALCFQIILLLVISSQELTFSFYVGISYLMTFLFSIMPKTKIKTMFFILATIPLFYGVYNIAIVPSQKLISFLLYDPILGNLAWIFTMLPAMLMLIRIDHLTHSTKFGHNTSLKELVALIFFAATTVLLLTLPTPTIPIQFHEIVDSTTKKRTVTVSSNTNLVGSFGFSIGEQTFVLPIRTGTRTITLPYHEPALRGDLTINQLGNLYQYNYTITNREANAQSYVITHTVPEPYNFIVRFTNIPTSDTISESVNTSDLYIGGLPPDIVHLEYRIEGEVPPSSTITANFNSLSEPFSIASEQIKAEILQTVIIQSK